MAGKEETKEKPKGSCLGRLAALFVVVVIGALGTAVWFIMQPQAMGDLAGRGDSAVQSRSRDVVAVLSNALEKGYPVTLSEEDINSYLKRTLKPAQGGFLGQWVKLEGAAVRLRGDVAEVILVRSILGRPFTVSMFLKVEMTESADGKITKFVHRHGGKYHEMLSMPMRGGRFGKLVVPQGFLILIWPSMESLAKVYEKELKLAGEEMARVKIEDGKVTLDPRPNTRSVPLPGGF